MMAEIIPWNGDRFIDQEIGKLIKRFNIQTVIETGCWSGHSTRRFRELLPLAGQVITVDSTTEHLTEEFGPSAVNDLELLGIKFVLGDSGIELPKLLRKIKYPLLAYIDAHGGGANGTSVNPLMEELTAIGKEISARDNCVIAIHDVKVPGKEFGYNVGDWGNGVEPISYDLVKPKLTKIYPNGYGFHHNDQAEGKCRGILYIYPTA